jgi:hypothetical protein
VVFDDATDPLAPRLLVSGSTERSVLAIDLDTGARAVLSSNAQGKGLALQSPSRLKIDAPNHRVLVVDGSRDSAGQTDYQYNRAALVAIDLTTGDRTTLADSFYGEGFLPTSPYGLALDVAAGKAYVANDWGGQIAAVDLTTLKRERFADSDVGQGVRLVAPRGLSRWLGASASNASAAPLLLADPFLKTIFRVDAQTGDRAAISGPRAGHGPLLQFPADVVFDTSSAAAQGRAFVLDGMLNGVFAVDLKTGDRSVLSSPDVGTGPALGNVMYLTPQALTLDAANHRLLVTNEGIGDPPAAVYAVDLTNGNRTLISSSARGVGVNFIFPDGVVIDDMTNPGAPRALVTNHGSLVSVDLATGDRSVFSPLSQGGGFPIFDPRRAVLNPQQGTLFFTDFFGFLGAVKLSNGSRALLSGRDVSANPGPDLGGGPSLDFPEALQVDFTTQVAFVGDSTRACVTAIDLPTGDRVLLSR